MTFLQPLLLIAIAAAAIPLILHLLTLRRLKVVPFSTLSFLKELQRTRIRAVRIKQLLLLVLRTLLILLIVLAFARPTVTGSLQSVLGGRAITDALIFFDDSYSMTLRGDQGTLLGQAGSSIDAILGGMTDDDRVLVLPFSGVASASHLADIPWVGPKQARQNLGSLKASPVFVSLEDVLREAGELLSHRTSPNRVLYVISDLQRGLVSGSVASQDVFSEGTDATFISVDRSSEENMSYRSVDLTTSIIEVGSPLRFELRLRNHGSAVPRTAAVSLFLNGQRLDQRVLTLEGGEERPVTLQGTPQQAGFQSGSIALEGDDAVFDNTHWFALNIPEERNILLVGTQDEVIHSRLALSAGGVAGRSGFLVTSVIPDQLLSRQLKDNDVFVVFDCELGEDIRETLLEQVREGKGLILVPSARYTEGSAPDRISRFVPGAFSGERASLSEGSFLTFGRTDLEHPIFEGMFEQVATPNHDKVRLESPDIFSFVRSRGSGSGTTIVSMGNGEPFLRESAMGSGRVLTIAVSLVPGWSTFPVSGLFVPLLHRSVIYVSGHKSVRPSVESGQELTLPLHLTQTMDLRLTSPDREQLPVQPTILPTGPVLKTKQAVLPGVYSLRSGDVEVDRFTANLSPRESDIERLDVGTITRLAASMGLNAGNVTYLAQGQDLGEKVYASRVGAELWDTLLILALIVALLETWLAGTRKPDTQGTIDQ